MANETFYPTKLESGDDIEVLATGFPGSVVSVETLIIAERRFSSIGLSVNYGDNVFRTNANTSRDVESRVNDIHNGFMNKKYKGLLSIIGGFDTNSLLSSIDWNIVEQNPKIVCGTSDLTTLLNAIHAKTGLVTYYGPHFSTFGQVLFNNYTQDSFISAIFENKPYELVPSEKWSDDKWYRNQFQRNEIANNGPWVLQPGSYEAQSIGGNLASLNLLQGTEYYPHKDSPIVFIEDIARNGIGYFERSLQSLLHVQKIGALLIGRMQVESDIDREYLVSCVSRIKELRGVPVIANLDFGHTLPMATLPIGGVIEVDAKPESCKINICKH